MHDCDCLLYVLSQSRRFKLNVGPNEYVGTLRRMIAAELQQEEPQRLRLIHGGECTFPATEYMESA